MRRNEGLAGMVGMVMREWEAWEDARRQREEMDARDEDLVREDAANGCHNANHQSNASSTQLSRTLQCLRHHHLRHRHHDHDHAFFTSLFTDQEFALTEWRLRKQQSQSSWRSDTRHPLAALNYTMMNLDQLREKLSVDCGWSTEDLSKMLKGCQGSKEKRKRLEMVHRRFVLVYNANCDRGREERYNDACLRRDVEMAVLGWNHKKSLQRKRKRTRHSEQKLTDMLGVSKTTTTNNDQMQIKTSQGDHDEEAWKILQAEREHLTEETAKDGDRKHHEENIPTSAASLSTTPPAQSQNSPPKKRRKKFRINQPIRKVVSQPTEEERVDLSFASVR